MKPHERSDLSLLGYEGPLRVFSEDQCAMIMRHWQDVHDRKIPIWPKALAVYDRVFYDLATRPLLVDRVCAHLGPDVVLWGASVVVRKPGRRHSWHSDAESCGEEGFLSVWVGLEGISQESALNVIPGSHVFGKPIQQIMKENGLSWAKIDNDKVLDMARACRGEAKIKVPAMQVGDAIFFDGRLWHGTENTSDQTRTALLFQYSRADCVVRRPTQYVDWPFGFADTPPPVLMVSGNAAQAPTAPVDPPRKGHLSPVTLEAVVRNWKLPLEGDPVSGWKPHGIAKGSTPNVSSMSVHASVLAPGKSPHPLHAHVEEEILLILDGEADILLGEGPDPDAAKIHRLTRGAFAYYPAYQYHTIRNASEGPVTYVMFKWSGPPIETEAQAQTAFVPFPDAPPADADSSSKGYHTSHFFKSPTAYLNRLHAHLTFLKPGSGYDRHSDTHDVAIVVLDGEVTSLGCKAGPGSVMYFPASHLHDMTNNGAAAARYLVLEFKGPEQNGVKIRALLDAAPTGQGVISAITQGGADACPGLKDIAPSGLILTPFGPEHLIEEPSTCALASKPLVAPGRRRPLLIRIMNSAISWLLSPLTRKIERVVDRRLRILLAEERKTKN
jgi:uncharacterized cupin superfamily protein